MRVSRLLVLTADYLPSNWSGIGVAVAHQARAVANLGYDVRVLMPFPPAAGGDGVRLHELSHAQFPLEPRTGDVVHLHSLSLAEVAIELARRFGLPLIYTAHSVVRLELRGREGCGRWAAVQNRVFQIADCVFFLSEPELDSALRLAPFLSDHASVLPNGLPEPPRCPSRQGLGQSVMFAGRLTRSKGIDLAADLCRRLLRHQRRTRFVIAGGHGDFHEQGLILQLVKDFPNECRFAGWVGRIEMERLLSQSALLIMPSRYEPFGLTALEALRVGTPVVGSAVGGLRSILKPHSGGIAIEGFDIDTWVHVCRDLLTDEGRLMRLSAQGPQYVASNFNMDVLARQFLKIIGNFY